jgi:hypothetical protein
MVLVAAISTGNKSAVDVQAVLYSLLAVASLFGLIGAIQRRLNLIEYFLWFLLAHVFLSLITGIFVLAVVFQNAAVAIQSCPPNGPSRLACVSSITLNRNISVPGIMVLWVLHFYTAWVVKNYRDDLLKELGGDEDDEKKLIGDEKLERPKTTYGSPLEGTLTHTPGAYNPTRLLAPNQGTYNPNLTPLQRNFSQPNRGPARSTYQSEVPLPSAVTRTTFPDPVKTTVSHHHKRSLSTSTYFDPTSFYLDQRNSQYPGRFSGLPQDREPPPPVPSLYSQNSIRRSRLTHSRSDSGDSVSRFSDDSYVSFDSLEEMLNPGRPKPTSTARLSMGSSLSSVPSLRRPPVAAIPRRF